MLLNSIVGQERAIVSEIPGTTRDPIDTLVRDEDGTILLIDTAGIRRRGSIDRGIERYSVLRAIRAIDRADVAVLVMDASELATAQDSHISNYILGAYKGIVLAVNKWDLAGELDITNEEAMRSVAQRFNFASFAPKCFISALNGTGTKELLKSVREVHVEWSKGLPRYGLRRTILSAVAQHPPPTTGRHALKVYSVAQDQTSPPSFTFYVNRANMVHFSYQRYLENALRKAYGFEGSPLRMRFRSRGNHWQNT
jgi:GTP-binding protein